jgi:Carboxypeptidase regulatory-like domain/TonB dependent receptor
MRRLIVLFAVVLVCCLPAMMAVAQSASTATLTGQVVDPQGAVISGAKITATNIATGLVRSTNTTGAGDYSLPNLAPGTYDVKVSAAKFSEGVAKGVTLNIGDQRDLNFKLGVAGTTQTVEVTAAAPLIETTKTEVSSVIDSLDMERLPTIAGAGGVVNDYAQLALTVPGVKADTSGLTNDMIAPGSINNRGNLYTVDGANITDQLVSGRDGTGASIDEVQEFKVITNNYNAEYGEATGLVMNVVTKSGTNKVHGDAHMYFRGRNLAASDPFYNDGIIGDPRCPDPTSVVGCPRAPFHRKEGGFTLGGPFMKDRLFWFTSFEMSRQGSPLTLTPGSAEGGNVTVQQPTNNLLYSGKVDYKVSQNNLLSARYAVDRLRDSNVIIQTGTNVTPDDLTSSTVNNAYLNVGLVSSITPNLVNQARFVFTRFVTSTSDNSSSPGVIHADGTTTGADFCCPQGGLQKRYQYVDDLSWTHGKHTFKGGLNISYYPWNSLFPQFHFGQYIMNPSDTAPSSLTVAFGPGEVTSKDNIYGFYFQDTWKLSRKLTVNAGIRYDFEAGAFKGGKNPGPGGTCFQGNNLIAACSSDKNNWQPRLGFTYAPWEKTLFKLSFAETTMLAFNNVVLDSLNFDGTTLTTVTIDPSNPPAGTTVAQNLAALAAFPNIPSAALLAPFAPSPSNFGRVRPISPNLKNPEMRMVNFGVEHQFTNTLKAGIQYIGQFGFGLFGEQDLNAAPLIADPNHAGFFYYGTRPNSSLGAVRTNENSRTSHYNGMLVSVDKKLSHHVQFVASYTWAHAITSGEDFFGLSEPGNEASCCRSELGPAFNDIRHAANMGVVLDSGRITPNRWAGVFANNLGLSWVGQLQSGRPYPISTGSAPFGGSERFFGAGNETQQRPSVLPDGTITTSGIASFDGGNALFGPGAVTACLTAFPTLISQCHAIQNAQAAPLGVTNTGAVDAVTGAPVTFQSVNGNLERDAGRGSPFVKFDASLHKSFNMPKYENVKLELRFDAFNIFNHSNLIAYNSNDILEVMAPSVTNAGTPGAVVNPDFFSCTGCMRPNGTYVGTNGATLHLSDLTHGNKIGGSPFNGLGNPGADDAPRKLQLSFHVRF